MFPDWHDNMHVPTIEDDVCIQCHTITVDSNSARPDNFQFRVQPRTKDGKLTKSGRAIGVLLKRTHEETALFLDKYLRPDIKSHEIDDLSVNLKNLLENYRSALDYTAHNIAKFCMPKPSPQRVQFPIAKPGEVAIDFEKKLDKWFPGLVKNSSKVRDYLLSIQEFNGDFWLRQLADLSNFNKHHTLSDQEQSEFVSTVVRFGDAGIRFGELGLRSLTIQTGGILRLLNTAGQHADVKGPCFIDAKTMSLVGLDTRIKIFQEHRLLYRIPKQNKSIAGTIWRISKNVFRAVDKINSFLPQ
jgi:hypothetical protein